MTGYKLKIDLNVLNHLGLNLYSNVPAVLSELIANAWDADSENVSISVEHGSNNGETIITISDDGCGMTKVDLNDKFLNVGYQRRKEEKFSLTQKHNRQVMRRKGIPAAKELSTDPNLSIRLPTIAL